MHRALPICLCTIGLAVTGCEKKTSISGTVTYNSTPIEDGYISFSPKKSGRTLASPITDGKYFIAEATPGQFTAVIVGRRKINHYSTSAEAYANAGKNAHVSEAADYIAQEAAGNNKDVDVSSGNQTFDFAISGPPAPKK
jgi:hypothetical protein